MLPSGEYSPLPYVTWYLFVMQTHTDVAIWLILYTVIRNMVSVHNADTY